MTKGTATLNRSCPERLPIVGLARVDPPPDNQSYI